MGAQYAVGPSRMTYCGVVQYPCKRLPDPLHVGIAECVGVEYGVSVVDTGTSTRLGTSVEDEYRASVVDTAAEGAALRSGVVLNPLRTSWFQTAQRSCAEVWIKLVSTKNQLDNFSLLKLTIVTVT
jgi:hypothetical protein